VKLLNPPLWESLLPLSERSVEELLLATAAPCYSEEQRWEAREEILRREAWETAPLWERAAILSACLSDRVRLWT
jgi:hypothetical protein